MTSTQQLVIDTTLPVTEDFISTDIQEQKQKQNKYKNWKHDKNKRNMDNRITHIWIQIVDKDLSSLTRE